MLICETNYIYIFFNIWNFFKDFEKAVLMNRNWWFCSKENKYKIYMQGKCMNLVSLIISVLFKYLLILMIYIYINELLNLKKGGWKLFYIFCEPSVNCTPLVDNIQFILCRYEFLKPWDVTCKIGFRNKWSKWSVLIQLTGMKA